MPRRHRMYVRDETPLHASRAARIAAVEAAEAERPSPDRAQDMEKPGAAGRLLALQRSVGNTSVRRLLASSTDVQREPVAPADTSAELEAVDDGRLLKGGQVGYARALQSESNTLADYFSDGEQAQPYATDFAEINEQITYLRGEQERNLNRANDTHGMPKYYHEEDAKWAGKKIDGVMTARTNFEVAVQQYQYAVPILNSFYGSVGQLRAMQSLVGGNDPASFASTLVSGLTDAMQVGMSGVTAAEQGANFNFNVNDTLDNDLNDMGSARDTLNTAWLTWKSKIALAQEVTTTDEEGNPSRTKLAALDDQKERITGAVKTMEMLVGGVNTVRGKAAGAAQAPDETALDNTPTGELQQKSPLSQAERISMMKQIMSGQVAVEGGEDKAPDTKAKIAEMKAKLTGQVQETKEMLATDTGISIPTDLEGVAGFLTDLWQRQERGKLEANLKQIATTVASLKGQQEALELQAVNAALLSAAQSYIDRLTQVKKALSTRTASFVQAGIMLDNFARSSKSLKGAGLGVGQGEDRYATLMTSVGQVQEALSFGRILTNRLPNMGAAIGAATNRGLSQPPYGKRTGTQGLDITPDEDTFYAMAQAHVRRYAELNTWMQSSFADVSVATGLFSQGIMGAVSGNDKTGAP